MLLPNFCSAIHSSVHSSVHSFTRQPGLPQRRSPFTLSGSLAIAIAALGCWIAPVRAEGSRELTSSGGDRPYLEYRNDFAGGIQRRTIISVYVNPGETINLGSSAVGLGSGRIDYVRPDGTTENCGTAGLIANRTEEVNGTFTPCTVPVDAGQGGVWRIHFVSPSPGSSDNPPAQAATADWTQPDNVGYVSAWDVTVRNSGGTAILGRVFTNAFALNVGSNGRSLSSAFRILTRDGYQYSIDLNGMDPFGFIFFSNSRGFRNASGNSIFRSLQFVGENPGSMPSGYSLHNPNNSDTSTDITHKIFINAPDPSLPASAPSASGSVWLYSTPVSPPIPGSFSFTGIEGTSGQAGTTPLGGNLVFNASRVGSYSIMLDTNQNGTYGDGNDRIFVGTTVVGTNTVFWDGRDASGAIVPASTVAYGARIVLYAGEAHFPFIDPENNPNGIVIRRMNGPTPPTLPDPDPYLIHYDDRYTGNSADYSLCSSAETGSTCYGTAPNPRSALAGVSSLGGARRFSDNFGDRRGIETWVYYPSQAVALQGGIQIQAADLEVTKTDGQTTIPSGSSIAYTVTVTNRGPSNVANARVLDTVPNSITGVSWSCAITSGTGSCGAANGSGNAMNTTVSLNNGAVATYTITGTVSPTASGTLTNTAEVQRPNDMTDPNPDNNRATDTTPIVPSAPPVNLILVKRITAVNEANLAAVVDDPGSTHDNAANWPLPLDPATGISTYLRGAIDGGTVRPGDLVEYTIYFLSSGTAPITNVNLCDLVPANSSFVSSSFSSAPESGMVLAIGSTLTNLTNVPDSDSGEYFIPGAIPSVACSASNTNGAIVVRVVQSPATLPPATAPGTPNSFGYIRFRARIR